MGQAHKVGSHMMINGSGMEPSQGGDIVHDREYSIQRGAGGVNIEEL